MEIFYTLKQKICWPYPILKLMIDNLRYMIQESLIFHTLIFLQQIESKAEKVTIEL